MNISDIPLYILCKLTGEKDIPKVTTPINILVWAAFLTIIAQVVILFVRLLH